MCPTKRKYKCYSCNQEFESPEDWSSEMAEKEYKENFPTGTDDKVVVCDVCFEIFRREIHG